MIVLRELDGRLYPADYILRNYRFVEFGKINNRDVAICSDYGFDRPFEVYVEEDKREELWKVHMNMEMGKGYHPTTKKRSRYRFMDVRPSANRFVVYEARFI